ncbi:protein of unknown function [Nitrospira japonica]|uniref:Uncharacterized protein n=1 Tax=Nitrospira japonica TaxID=1325564 RepID=A0A1W1I895_9BACT|nr:protein of unknown function [Nitrospira japonica]
MLQHHDTDLDRALDRLYLDGAVSIPWDHLYIWFNVDRLSKGAYREIKQRWEKRCTYYGYKKAPALSILQGNNSYPYLLRIIREPFQPGEDLVRLDSEI